MSFSRANPSPRYRELTALYRQMHVEGERFLGTPPSQTFPGASLPQAPRIKRMVEATGAQNILDYGCGKGQQYELRNVRIGDEGVFESIQDYWDVDYVHCYDPSYEPYSALPEGQFDGVICTDVLEHCPEQDVDWIVGELFSYARLFVYANVASYPATKRLPTGENAHCTIQPPPWWANVFLAVAARHPGIAWRCSVTERSPEGKIIETILKG